MKFVQIIYFFNFIFINQSLSNTNPKTTVYGDLPPLYRFDDYQTCSQLEPLSGVYCMVYAEIVPSKDKPLWRRIDELSKDVRHYRHDRLLFGVCLNKCQHLAKISENLNDNITVDRTTVDVQLIFYYNDLYNYDEGNQLRAEHKELINECLIREFKANYELELRTFVEHCQRRGSAYILDKWHYGFIGFATAIILLVVSSSLYDIVLKVQKSARQHINSYKCQFSYKRHALWTSFSLLRTLNDLTHAPTTKLGKDFCCLDGLRVICTWFIILANVVLLSMTLPMENPEFFEKAHGVFKAWLCWNITAIYQLYFFLYGFSLYVRFLDRNLVGENSNLQQCLRVYFRTFAYRILRILPSLVLLLLFSASFLDSLQDGPFWRHFIESERIFSRVYWWKNIFFINNFDLATRSALHHTWLIATDVQLFSIFLVLIIGIIKFPFIRIRLLSVLSMVAILLPIFATCILKFDSLFTFSPENYRYLFTKDSTSFLETFVPIHMNYGAYIGAIWVVAVYLKSKPNPTNTKSSWIKYYRPLFLIIIIGGFIVEYWFLCKNGGRFTFWELLCVRLFHYNWTVLFGVVVFECCHRVGGIFLELLSSTVFRILSRISFQTVLWHMVVVRFLVGSVREPICMSYLNLIIIFIATVVFTYIIALFVTLILERPIAKVIECLEERTEEWK